MSGYQHHKIIGVPVRATGGLHSKWKILRFFEEKKREKKWEVAKEGSPSHVEQEHIYWAHCPHKGPHNFVGCHSLLQCRYLITFPSSFNPLRYPFELLALRLLASDGMTWKWMFTKAQTNPKITLIWNDSKVFHAFEDIFYSNPHVADLFVP